MGSVGQGLPNRFRDERLFGQDHFRHGAPGQPRGPGASPERQDEGAL
jgi:hypothetical protein